MMKLYCFFLLFYFTLFTSSSFGQYILNGSATQNSCNCYTLTQPAFFQTGSVWNSNKINLSNSFDFKFNVYLGCNNATGADGIVFILQPISTNIGTTGAGMGFEGISPSVGISIDTWQNINIFDPPADHFSIQTNGHIAHDGGINNLTPAVESSIIIDDCQWHLLRITWDASTYWLRAYFDGMLKVEAQKNLVTDIFGNDPMVYWGFSGATGGAVNLQQFCTVLEAGLTTNSLSDTTCLGTPVQFVDNSVSFTTIQNFYWDLGDGFTSSLSNPPPHVYTLPGSYLVKHVITGMDGCVSDTAYKTITVGAIPIANFSVNDTCFGFPSQATDQSTCSFGTINQWTWLLDGNFLSNAQNPALPVLSVGVHSLELNVSTEYGCVTTPVTKNFTVKPVPSVDFIENSGCINQAVQFNGVQTDNQTSIAQWSWGFDDGSFSQVQNPVHLYNIFGNYLVTLYVIATNNCRAVAQHTVVIGAKPVAQFLVHDTCEGNSPVILNSSSISSGSISQWNWILDGQAVSNSQTPALGSLTTGQHQLKLNVTSNVGCVSDTTAHDFTIRNRPVINASGADGCYRQPIQFNASQTDNNTNIQNWTWNFGDGGTAVSQNPTHNFNSGGNYNVSVTAIATNGCSSAAVQFPVKINQLTVNAGNDTIVLLNAPFNLNGTASSATAGQLTYLWTPATGLNNQNLLNPVSSLSDNIVYKLTVTSAEGCVATDQVSIEVFKGSEIYVPSGFTPNHDGKNDVLHPKYIGIRTLNYFTVYNRWGQLVFTTKDMSKGWDGTINGRQQSSGVFVWVINAVDLDGKKYELKGTTAIIR